VHYIVVGGAGVTAGSRGILSKIAYSKARPAPPGPIAEG